VLTLLALDGVLSRVDGVLLLAAAAGYIALTVVAIGTSAPEIVIAAVATIRGERDVAVGNLIGSSVYDVVVILGLTCLVPPHGVLVDRHVLVYDLPLMTGVAALCVPVFERTGQGFFFALEDRRPVHAFEDQLQHDRAKRPVPDIANRPLDDTNAVPDEVLARQNAGPNDFGEAGRLLGILDVDGRAVSAVRGPGNPGPCPDEGQGQGECADEDQRRTVQIPPPERGRPAGPRLPKDSERSAGALVSCHP
jgi:hypothetical protein